MIKERTLKIHVQPNGRFVSYPDIRLAGKWLMDQGFMVGDYVRVMYRKNLIVIKRIDGGTDEKTTTEDE